MGGVLSRLNWSSSRFFLPEKPEVLFLLFQAQFLEIFVLHYDTSHLLEKLFMLHLKFFFLHLFFSFSYFSWYFLKVLCFSLAIVYIFILELSFHCACRCVFCCTLSWMASNSWCLLYSSWSADGMSWWFSPVVTSPFAFQYLYTALSSLQMGIFSHHCLDYTLHFSAYFLQFFFLVLNFNVFVIYFLVKYS